MELILLTLPLFVVGCVGLLFLALTLPLLERFVSLADKVREVLKSGALDLIQILRSFEQSQVDSVRAKNKLEIDTDRAEIETNRLAGKLQFAQDYAALRLLQFRRNAQKNEVVKQ